MAIAVVCGVALLVGLLDLFATNRVLRSAVHSRGQETAWLLLVWLVPVFGAILALQASSGSNSAAQAPKSLDSGPEAWIPGIGPPSDDGSSGGHSA